MDTFVILREKREGKKLTVSIAAKELGISISMLSKLENGKTSITQKMADKLNNYYNINIEPQGLRVIHEEYVPRKPYKYEELNEELKKENKSLKKEIERLNEELAYKDKIIECIKAAIDGEGTISIRRKNYKGENKND